MKKYECTICGYVYDEAIGDPEHGVPAGTPWDKLPADWVCPLCGVGKSDFEEKHCYNQKNRKFLTQGIFGFLFLLFDYLLLMLSMSFVFSCISLSERSTGTI